MGSREKWNIVFYATAAFYIVGFICFEIFASAERQAWAKVDTPHTPDLALTEINVRPYIRRESNYHNNGTTNRLCKKKVESENNVAKNRISRLKNKKNGKRLKSIDTHTPEWINFKRTNYVY